MPTKTLNDCKIWMSDLLATAVTDTGLWSDDEKTRYINDSQRTVAALLPDAMLEDLLVISGIKMMSAGQHNPTLTKEPTVMRLRSVGISKTTPIQAWEPVIRVENMEAFMTKRKHQFYASSSVQSNFYHEAGKWLYFHPTYSKPVYYNYWYLKVPAEMTVATDKISLADHLMEWIVFNAVVAALMKAGKWAEAGNIHNYIRGRMQDFHAVWRVGAPIQQVVVPK